MSQSPDQDERVTRLKTPEECEQFAINVADRHPELAQAANRRGVELKARKHNAATDVEREALKAVFAYEQALSEKHGKKMRATRTWQMIERRGIIEAVEQAVDRTDDPQGVQSLSDMGLEDLSFEAIVLRYPDSFSAKAAERARQRMTRFSDDSGDSR